MKSSESKITQPAITIFGTEIPPKTMIVLGLFMLFMSLIALALAIGWHPNGLMIAVHALGTCFFSFMLGRLMPKRHSTKGANAEKSTPEQSDD